MCAVTIVMMFACSNLMRFCSNCINSISLLCSGVLLVVLSVWLSKNTTVGVSLLVALIFVIAFSILGVDLYLACVSLIMMFSGPIGGLSNDVSMNNDGSLAVMMLKFWLASESIVICSAFSDWSICSASIVKNDLLTSHWELLWRAACFEPTLKSSPGDFFGVLVRLRDTSFFPQMVSLFGVVGALLVVC